MAENTAKNIESYKTTTNEATQVAQNESDEGVNVNTFTDNKLILNSYRNDIQNATEVHRPSNLHFNSLRVITELTENVHSVENYATKVHHNVHKTVNDISHINHRPSNLYFNPSRL